MNRTARKRGGSSGARRYSWGEPETLGYQQVARELGPAPSAEQ